ncbi:MAG: sigma 54-interacting transcriptional regulator [Myxococcales bacterium]|nr:sigma 54-interacting transcriptional regulator [Myxococcales bacterium]
MVASSVSMLRLFGDIERIAAAPTSVLIVGESGTGKERVAEALHAHSGRGAAPLVTIDCGALPSKTLASELFGHERGAFTGADRIHPGAFERAGNGTVFLDEIGSSHRQIRLRCSACSSDGGSEGRRHGGSRGRCARGGRHQPRPPRPRSTTVGSGTISTIASRWWCCASPRSASAATSAAARRALRAQLGVVRPIDHVQRRGEWRAGSGTHGRATCASCEMPSRRRSSSAQESATRRTSRHPMRCCRTRMRARPTSATSSSLPHAPDGRSRAATCQGSGREDGSIAPDRPAAASRPQGVEARHRQLHRGSPSACS